MANESNLQNQPPKAKQRWIKALEYSVWALVAGLLLYRFVLPHPSAPIDPKLASARLDTDGAPLMVEFSSTR